MHDATPCRWALLVVKTGAEADAKRAQRRNYTTGILHSGGRSHPRPLLGVDEVEGARAGKWCILRRRR